MKKNKMEISKPKTTISYAALMAMVANGAIYLHHTASFRGYVSRKIQADKILAYPYKGRYGTGYTVDLPNKASTRYSFRVYFIF